MTQQLTTDIQAERDLLVPLADGTLLSADLYRPAGAPPGPVVVSYYPYRKDDIIGSLFEGCRIRLCERGYASLFVDVAGTGASQGSWQAFELAREGRDLAEIIEWAAGQDWCDGSVGAWGVSYGGMTALAAAAVRPPHLRAIMAAYATTDIHRDSISRGGCPMMLGRYAWSAHMVALGLLPPTRQDAGGGWRRLWLRRLEQHAAGQPPALDWQAHPQPDDAYWQARQVDATAIEVPVMLIGGWADTYKDAMVRAFSEVTGPKRLVLGPWMHVLPHLSQAEPYDWVGAMADWWDAHLRPAPTSGPESAPVLFFAAGQGWRAARQWPPEGVLPMHLFLSGHRLDPVPPASAGRRDYRADPLAGTSGGLWDPFGTGSGWPEEQSGDDARSLTFTSRPLPEPLLIAGNPQAELHLAVPSGAEAQLAVRLCMVSPDGRSTLITAGWLRLPPARPGPGPDGPDGPGGAGLTAATVSLGPAAVAVPAGTRLRLSVACADFPRVWPALDNPDLVVGFGAGCASVLRIPAATAASRTDTPVVVQRPPGGTDSGWVTDGEPAFCVNHDKVNGEVSVTFGASSGLAAPSGARLRLSEQFTARVQAARPDGASVQAQVTARARMPAGEQVEVQVRSTSTRQATFVDALVEVDGACLLRHSWAAEGSDPGHPEDPPAGPPEEHR